MLDRCTVIELFNWKNIFKSWLMLNIIVPGVLVQFIKMSSWHLEGEIAQKQLYLLLSLWSSLTLEQIHTTSSEGIGYHLVFCNPKTWAKTKRLPKYLGSSPCQVQHFGENWTKVFWLSFLFSFFLRFSFWVGRNRKQEETVVTVYPSWMWTGPVFYLQISCYLYSVIQRQGPLSKKMYSLHHLSSHHHNLGSGGILEGKEVALIGKDPPGFVLFRLWQEKTSANKVNSPICH